MDNQDLESLRKRAWTIYNADVKHLVEPELNGKYLALNVETGHYEIDERLGLADFRTPEKHKFPKGVAAPLCLPHRLPDDFQRAALGKSVMPISGRVNGNSKRTVH